MIRKFNVRVNGKSYEVEVEELNSSESTQTVAPVHKPVQQPVQKVEQVPAKKVETPKPAETHVSSGNNVVKAPLPGVVVDITVSEGARVSKGQKLLVIEAMKMENEILSDYDGVVEKILVKKGDNVDGDQDLIIIS
jgi:biotin carboxyl carrier protein